MAQPAANIAEDRRRREWLAARREVVTSTGVAALMKVEGAYGSPLREFFEKIDRCERGESEEWMEWGKRLQQTIGVAYAERVGLPIEFVDEYDFFRSPTCPFLGASLDVRVQGGDRRPVDCKNIGFQDPQDWGEEWTDEFPARYIIQGHVQMEVTQTSVFDLAVLFGGRKLVVYRCERDEEIIAGCRHVSQRFWEDHVIPARAAIAAGEDPMRWAPPVDGSGDWTKFLSSRKQRYEKYLDVSTMPDQEGKAALYWAEKLEQAKRAKDSTEEEEALAANHLRQLIGENAGLMGPFGRIHYKRNKNSVTFDSSGYIEYLERIARAAGAKPLALARVKRKKFTGTKPGARPLSPKWTKEELKS